MGAPDIKVDTIVLGDVADALGKVKNGLDSTKNTTDKASGAVSHPHLAREIRSFHIKWDGRREKITETVNEIQKSAISMKDAFEEWDKKMAEGLEGSGSG
jgi:uncharacterized coiled-coil DUF342 family protein